MARTSAEIAADIRAAVAPLESTLAAVQGGGKVIENILTAITIGANQGADLLLAGDEAGAHAQVSEQATKLKNLGDILNQIAGQMDADADAVAVFLDGFAAEIATEPPDPPGTATVTRFGITLTLDEEYQVSSYAGGDQELVADQNGEVRVVGISPASAVVSGRTMHGAMLNPSPRLGITQGYDSTMPRCPYDAAVNVALDVSSTKPLVLRPGDTLACSISRPEAGVRPQPDTIAVFTVADQAAPTGSLRPPYCGSGADKSIRFNESQIDVAKLPKVETVASQPTWSTAERWFERPWMDHVQGWQGDRAHPQQNMPNYGREMADRVGNAALMLCLDVPDAVKHLLAVKMVQLGIDLMGLVNDGGDKNWDCNGGVFQGRKFPILFAGLMLGDQEMLDIGTSTVWFGEDRQTFYVRETSPGVFNHGNGGYTAAHKDMPEWGIRHASDPKQDDVRWDGGNGYRLCCTANSFLGYVLAARMMGLMSAWNHDALFDYQDRYLRNIRQQTGADVVVTAKPSWQVSWSAFPLDMWDKHRATYGSIWGSGQ